MVLYLSLLLGCGPKSPPAPAATAVSGDIFSSCVSQSDSDNAFQCGVYRVAYQEGLGPLGNPESLPQTTQFTLEQISMGAGAPLQHQAELSDARLPQPSLVTRAEFANEVVMVLYVGPEPSNEEAVMLLCVPLEGQDTQPCMEMAVAVSQGQIPSWMRPQESTASLGPTMGSYRFELPPECTYEQDGDSQQYTCPTSVAVWQEMSGLSMDTEAQYQTTYEFFVQQFDQVAGTTVEEQEAMGCSFNGSARFPCVRILASSDGERSQIYVALIAGEPAPYLLMCFYTTEGVDACADLEVFRSAPPAQAP